jgi:hypothetical protein
MHGGSSPGAPRSKANGNYRHGRFTRETLQQRRMLSGLSRPCGKTAGEV